MKFRQLIFCMLLAPLGLFGAENPDDLKVGDELPGPLGYNYTYGGKEASYVNVRIVENHFRAYFLAEDQKTIVEPEWTKAIIHYGNAVRKGLNKNTTSLALAEGSPYLYGARIIQPPYRYWIQLILQNKADVEATDNYNQVAPKGADSFAFPTAILNQLTQQDTGDTDSAVGDNLNGVPVSN